MTQLPTDRRPGACLRIGVTGHRRNKLTAADEPRLAREVRHVLSEMQHGLDDPSLITKRKRSRPFGLEIVSALAEGADRIVAKAALDHGAELIALLPFARDIYATDFLTPASRAEYTALLGRAKRVVEMPGRHAAEDDRLAAYSAVGAHLVELSDILIAVWDGEEASGTGGTAEVVELALRAGRSVLWLPTSEGEASPAARLLLADRTIDQDAIGATVDIARKILLGMDCGS